MNKDFSIRNKTLVFVSLTEHLESPSQQRMQSFQDFFQSHNVNGIKIDRPNNVLQLIETIFYIYKKGYRNIWVSMPPFRLWSLLLLPFVRSTIDVRDGWSVAIKTGYGGTAHPSPIKARVAWLVEFFVFLFCHRIVTCTPGLVDYFNKNFPKFIARKIILVPNGFYKYYGHLSKPTISQEKTMLICAGKFSEYGRSKVEKVLATIAKRYGDKQPILQLIGANPLENDWIQEFCHQKKYPIEFKLLPRKNREELAELLSESNIGVAIIRDPDYDLGTKSFEYIAHGLPILNYFEEDNNFTLFFKDFLDTSDENKGTAEHLSRHNQVEKNKERLLDIF